MRTTTLPPAPPSWTPGRQLIFLRCYEATGSVAEAAAAAGMSRTSAYRLRRREPGGLFALTWTYLARHVVAPGHGRS